MINCDITYGARAESVTAGIGFGQILFLTLVSVVVLFQVLAWIRLLLFSRNIHKQLGHRYRS